MDSREKAYTEALMDKRVLTAQVEELTSALISEKKLVSAWQEKFETLKTMNCNLCLIEADLSKQLEQRQAELSFANLAVDNGKEEITRLRGSIEFHAAACTRYQNENSLLLDKIDAMARTIVNYEERLVAMDNELHAQLDAAGSLRATIDNQDAELSKLRDINDAFLMHNSELKQDNDHKQLHTIALVQQLEQANGQRDEWKAEAQRLSDKCLDTHDLLQAVERDLECEERAAKNAEDDFKTLGGVNEELIREINEMVAGRTAAQQERNSLFAENRRLRDVIVHMASLVAGEVA